MWEIVWLGHFYKSIGIENVQFCMEIWKIIDLKLVKNENIEKIENIDFFDFFSLDFIAILSFDFIVAIKSNYPGFYISFAVIIC